MQLQKLIKKINSSYKKFLESYVLDVETHCNVSLQFSIPKIPIKGNENTINAFQLELKKLSDKNEGLKLNTIVTQKGTIIESVEFENLFSYLKFINKTKDFDNFCKNIDLINEKLPILKVWIQKNITKINDNDKKWEDLIKVIKYFILNPKPNLYIRELPIKVHTKFIENNKKIIDEILQFINEAEDNVFNFIGDNFEQKYGLKSKPIFIRFRYLDNSINIKDEINVYDDLYLRIPDFKKSNIICKKVFIVENETNYLTFPKVEDSIIIWGKGFNISNLKNIKWLEKKEIYYWGDLDSHGFKILAQCKKYYPQTKSIFMDKKTYDEFKQYEVVGKILGKEEVINIGKNLNLEEYNLLEYLNDNNLRLEQENISQDFIKNDVSTLYF